jgi:hypothetical protein
MDLKTIKSDFHHVFVDGDAKGSQQLHVVILLGIPFLVLVLILVTIFHLF